MKIKEIQNLIKFVAKSGASEVKLEMEDVKITIKTNDGSQPVVIQETAVVPQQVIQTQPVSPEPSVPLLLKQMLKKIQIILQLNHQLLVLFTASLHQTNQILLKLVILFPKVPFFV